MRLRYPIALGILVLAVCGVVLAQKPFREWPAIEYENFPVPDDWNQKASGRAPGCGNPDIYGYPYRELTMTNGREFPGYWTMDYPRPTGICSKACGASRASIHARWSRWFSFDGSDDMFNYPTLYAVEVGHWLLSDENAKQLREFLLRGGFLMVDDFHGSNADDHYKDDGQNINEWANFTAGMNKVFPDRVIEDLPDNDPIFHTIYDLNDRFQVPGAQYFDSVSLTKRSHRQAAALARDP